MKRFWITFLLCLSGVALAAGITAISGLSSLTNQQEEIKSTANALWSYAASLLSGEDETNSVFRVEQQMSYAVDDADIIAASAGFLHTFQCWPEDATAEAGSVAIRDADTAGTGTIIWQDTIAAAAYVPGDHNPKVPFDMVLTTGLVIDFTTTTDVFCTVSYR